MQSGSGANRFHERQKAPGSCTAEQRGAQELWTGACRGMLLPSEQTLPDTKELLLTVPDISSRAPLTTFCI